MTYLEILFWLRDCVVFIFKLINVFDAQEKNARSAKDVPSGVSEGAKGGLRKFLIILFAHETLKSVQQLTLNVVKFSIFFLSLFPDAQFRLVFSIQTILFHVSSVLILLKSGGSGFGSLVTR